MHPRQHPAMQQRFHDILLSCHNLAVLHAPRDLLPVGTEKKNIPCLHQLINS
jgi:hypothetical protein